MRNKSNFSLWCMTALMLCIELAACGPSQIAPDTPTAIVTRAAAVSTGVVITRSATLIPDTFSCTQVTDIPQLECAALVALYKSTNGPNWADDTNWLKTNSPCDWAGVQCLIELGEFSMDDPVVEDHVRELILGDNRLSGIVTPEIRKLSYLTELHLWNNQLTSLPSEIGNLSKLHNLNLDDNQLTSLPPEIGNLSSLTQLSLIENHLTSLPPEIGNLSNLGYLDLDGNQLTDLPPEIGNLPYLSGLDLSNNKLAALTPEIGNLSHLVELQLDGNPFASTVPPSITNLVNLSYLYISPCSGLTSDDPDVTAFLDARSPGWNQCP